jgi:hypothetical protein
MAGETSIRDKRAGETDLQWRLRLARRDAMERDRKAPLVTPEAERHGDYRDTAVMHVETQTIAVTKRRMDATPLQVMHDRGGITTDQLEAAQQIEMAHEIVVGGVSVRGASLEARVDNSGAGRDVLIERLYLVQIEVIYSRWRLTIPTPKRMILDMIVSTKGPSAVARRYRTGWPKARRQLIRSLDSWLNIRDQVAKQIDERDVENAQKRVGGGVIL